MPKTETPVSQLKINRLTKTQFDGASDLSGTELYAVDPEFTGGKFLKTDSNGNVVESNVTQPVVEVTVNGTSVVSDGIAAIANMVTTDTAQEITGRKQFDVGSVTDTLVVKRTNSSTSGTAIRFENNSGVLGGLGYSGGALPYCTGPDNSSNKIIVRCGPASSPAVGDTATPVYVDSNGVAQTCSLSNGYVTTNTAQTITGEKTITTALNITGSGDNNALRLSEGTRINVFGTTKTILGFTGIGGNQYRFLINHSSYELMLRGLNARPYYNDTNTTLALSSDVPTTPSDIGAEPATSVVSLADASTITLASNTIYNGSTLTSLTIQLPSGVDNAFTSEIDFTSGATATTFTYPNTLKWIEGDDVNNQIFTPAVNKRYICMIIWDGTQFVGTVRGVE